MSCDENLGRKGNSSIWHGNLQGRKYGINPEFTWNETLIEGILGAAYDEEGTLNRGYRKSRMQLY